MLFDYRTGWPAVLVTLTATYAVFRLWQLLVVRHRAIRAKDIHRTEAATAGIILMAFTFAVLLIPSGAVGYVADAICRIGG